MKLMINGAVTLGTLDGANVEIFEQVGKDNIFLFGMNVDEVNALWARGYNPNEFVASNEELRQVINMLTSGVLGRRFDDIAASLLTNRYGTADQYMTLADFGDYARAQKLVSETYSDKYSFMKMSLTNVAKAGIFSADRSVLEYADKIWKMR
jgi:starch phosphorylase